MYHFFVFLCMCFFIFWIKKGGQRQGCQERPLVSGLHPLFNFVVLLFCCFFWFNFICLLFFPGIHTLSRKNGPKTTTQPSIRLIGKQSGVKLELVKKNHKVQVQYFESTNWPKGFLEVNQIRYKERNEDPFSQIL